jgi:hypothetical protein
MLPDQPRLFAGKMLLPMSLIRCGGPSAIRTRTAANRAFSLPLVPSRQLTFFHLASASMSCAGIDIKSGMGRYGGDHEVHACQLFVAALGASSFTYAEATFTQTLPDWIGSHRRDLAHERPPSALWLACPSRFRRRRRGPRPAAPRSGGRECFFATLESPASGDLARRCKLRLVCIIPSFKGGHAAP